MSLWNSFLDNIAKPVGKALETGAGQVVDFVGQSFAGIVPTPSKVISGIAIDAGIEMGVSPILNAQGLSEAASQGLKENLKYQTNRQAQSNDITSSYNTPFVTLNCSNCCRTGQLILNSYKCHHTEYC
jgi:hypothetical protein